MKNNPYTPPTSETVSPKKRVYHLPFLGGLTAGCGVGLLVFPLLAQYGFIRWLGFVGVIGLALILLVVGLLIGLPSRASRYK